MANQNPTTLVMLLLMVKLQQGQMPVGGYDKRWQTPEEVYAQTHEAVTHLQNAGHMPKKIVLLYTDNLYLNNDGPVMQSLEAIQQQRLQIFKGRPLRAMDKPNTTTWLDVSVKDQPIEKTVYNFTPHPEAMKNAAAIVPKKKLGFLQSKPWKVAVSLALPIIAAATWLVTKPKAEWKNPEPVIHENYYAATVSWYSWNNPDQKMTLTFKKDSANQKPKDWHPVLVQYADNDPARELIFEGDLGSIQIAEEVLEKKYHFKSDWTNLGLVN